MDYNESARILNVFRGADLTKMLAGIEKSVKGLESAKCDKTVNASGASADVLAAAGMVKKLAGQINVVIHATGILMCLPQILELGEVVQYVSLGAGNTGRRFDLETDRRVAEFKFIRWRGADSIREGALFKDFYLLAEHFTPKRKYMYVLGTEYPLKFLNGGRAIESVLEKYARLLARFTETHRNTFATVRDYCQARGTQVTVADVSPWVSGLVADEADEVSADQ
jgi:hypothetical protein